MTSESAVGVIGGTMVLMVAGGAWFSTMSAVRGPRWSLGHIRALRSGGLTIAAVGLVLAVMVQPRWLGLSILYLAGVVAFLAWALGRSLARMDAVGALDDFDEDGRSTVIKRAKIGLLVGSLAFAAFATVLTGVLAFTMTALSLALLANWIGLRLVSTTRTQDPQTTDF